MDLASEEHFRLDFVMVNRSYVHEWNDRGWVYMQVFPHGKMYAGQSINIDRRFGDYRRHSGSNPHHTNALKKYGWENVRKIVVKVPKFLLDRVETELIELYDLMDPDKGYNKTSGGRTNGYRLSTETRKKIGRAASQLRKRNWQDPEYRKKMSGENHYLHGKTISEETREKIRQGNLGKIMSDESKKKLSESHSGEKNGFFGKTHSEETKEKLRRMRIGVPLSEETKEKIRQANVGKTHTEETKAKMSLKQSGENHPMFGKHHSEEAKEKIRQTSLGRTHTDETKEKLREINIGRIVSDETKEKLRKVNIGKTLTEETKIKLSAISIGSNNPRAKPIVAFGKLFACGKYASDHWRAEKAPDKEKNFITEWTKTKKYSHDVFWVSKYFYEKYKDSEEYITREMYDAFILLLEG